MPTLTVASTLTATPTPSDSSSPNASASPSPSASPCVPTTDGPPGTGSCEDTPVVTVTACDGGGNTAATGGAISWSGADGVDSFWIWPPGNGAYPIVLYEGSGNLPLTPTSGSYGPLAAGAYTYQFADNTNEIFNGSFTILTCASTPTITYCTNGGSLGVGLPCPGVTFTTACVAGDPGVGSVTFTFTQGKSELGDVPDSITFDGNVVGVDGANPFFFGPTNAGTYPVIVDGYDLSVTIPACPG